MYELPTFFPAIGTDYFHASFNLCLSFCLNQSRVYFSPWRIESEIFLKFPLNLSFSLSVENCQNLSQSLRIESHFSLPGGRKKKTFVFEGMQEEGACLPAKNSNSLFRSLFSSQLARFTNLTNVFFLALPRAYCLTEYFEGIWFLDASTHLYKRARPSVGNYFFSSVILTRNQ